MSQKRKQQIRKRAMRLDNDVMDRVERHICRFKDNYQDVTKKSIAHVLKRFQKKGQQQLDDRYIGYSGFAFLNQQNVRRES